MLMSNWPIKKVEIEIKEREKKTSSERERMKREREREALTAKQEERICFLFSQ